VAVDGAVRHEGAATDRPGPVVFPFIRAEIEGFFKLAAGIPRRDALFDLAGTVTSGVELEVRQHPAGGENLNSCEGLQGRGAQVIEFGELAEGGKGQMRWIKRNAEMQRSQRGAQRGLLKMECAIASSIQIQNPKFNIQNLHKSPAPAGVPAGRGRVLGKCQRAPVSGRSGANRADPFSRIGNLC